MTPVALLGQAAALLTAIAAVVYAAGSMVLYEKSWFEYFPWNSLLQDFDGPRLQLLGAAPVLLATIVGIAAAPLVDLVPRQRRGVGVAILPLLLPVPAVVAVWFLRDGQPIQPLYRPLPEVYGNVVLLGYLFVLAAVSLQRLTAHQRQRRRTRIAAAGRPQIGRPELALVLGVCFVPMTAGLWASFPYPPTTVCTAEHGAQRGVSLGTSSETTFVGVLPPETPAGPSTDPRTVVAVPLGDVIIRTTGSAYATCPATTAAPEK